MKNSTKAVLLSALLYPGAGHIWLKKHVRGVLLISVTSITLVVVLSTVFSHAMRISEQIVAGEIAPEIAAIREMIKNLQSPAETQLIGIATAIILITWVIGVIDVYRIAKPLDDIEKLSE